MDGMGGMDGGHQGLDVWGAVLEDCCKGEGDGDCEMEEKYEKGFRDVWSGGGMDVEVHIEGPQGVCDPHVGHT